MNKKLIALALILLVAMGGLFAEVTLPTNAVATLKANLGDIFIHGIVDGDNYKASENITDAFNVTPPSFYYGYETNVAGAPYYIRMSVGDFLQKDSGGAVIGTIKIKTVSVDGGSATKVWDAASSSYTIFTVPTNNTFTKTSTKITIAPLRAEGLDHRGANVTADKTMEEAPSGAYEAAITFSVSGS